MDLPALLAPLDQMAGLDHLDQQVAQVHGDLLGRQDPEEVVDRPVNLALQGPQDPSGLLDHRDLLAVALVPLALLVHPDLQVLQDHQDNLDREDWTDLPDHLDLQAQLELEGILEIRDHKAHLDLVDREDQLDLLDRLDRLEDRDLKVIHQAINHSIT